MILSLIAAVSENGVIGRDQTLPWHLPADLKRFKQITTGHPVVMGRKTFDSVGKPLPHRPNIVISKNAGLKIAGAKVVGSLDEALEPFVKTDEEIFILGGGEIFKQSLSRADRLYLTVIHKSFPGDTYFPDFDRSQFEIVFEEHHEHPLPFSFLNYERKVRK